MKSHLQIHDALGLSETLIRDALVLLPEPLRKRFRVQPGALVVDDKTSSPAYILKHIYGADIEAVSVPEAIYYEGFNAIESIETSVKEGKSNFSDPKKLYRDQYNLALNLLVNLWLTDLAKDNSQIEMMPKEGVYLRDSTGGLYFYEEG